MTRSLQKFRRLRRAEKPLVVASSSSRRRFGSSSSPPRVVSYQCSRRGAASVSMDVDDRSGDASTRGSAGASSSAVVPEDGSDASSARDESTHHHRYHAHAQTDHASADVRTAFQLEVREAFYALVTTYGFDPNDAAALALKLAAKMAEWPLDLRGLLDACARASAVPSPRNTALPLWI